MTIFGKPAKEIFIILGLVLVGLLIIYRVLPAKFRAIILGA